MLRQNGFEAVLIKINHKAKSDQDKVVIEFTIRHVSEYEKQTFLESLEQKVEKEVSLMHLFKYPVPWKNMALDANLKFKLDFDELDGIECVLKQIKIKRKLPVKLNESEAYVYDMTFEKELESGDEDAILASYLNRREEDENGRFYLIKYHVLMTYVPPLQKDMFDKEE